MIAKSDFDEIINNPDTIFHYTTFRTAMERILFENQLRFSTKNKTNDPHEYSDRAIVFWPDNFEINIDGRFEVQHIINRIIKSEYKIACFCSNNHPIVQSKKDEYISSVPKRYGYDRLRMWSQYGENYYGVCIAFSRAAIEEHLEKQQFKKVCDYVNYVDDLTDISGKIENININQTQKEQDNNKLAKTHIQANLKELFFVKRKDYIDEAEYRIIVHDPDNKFEPLDISASVKAVLLGDRFNKVYRETILSLCNKLSVECKKLEWRNGKFQMSNI